MPCICPVAAAAGETLACLQQRGCSYRSANSIALNDAIVHSQLKAVTAIRNTHAKATAHDSAVHCLETMLKISSAPALDGINVSTAMRAVEAVHYELCRAPSALRTQQEYYAMLLRAPAAKFFQRLQQMLPHITAREAGSIALSGARLRLPLSVMPSDLVTELICKVDMDRADMSDSHAHSISQLLTAMAVWAGQGRDISADQVQSLSEQFAAHLTRPAIWNNPETYYISSKVMRSLVGLKAKPSVAMLDVLWAHFCHAMSLLSVTASQKLYSICRMFWCCSKLHYLPSANQAAAMLAMFTGPFMMSLPKDMQAHHTSYVLSAIATLGLDCAAGTKVSLARMYIDNSVGRFLPNAMWGMAVLNVLNIATFDKLDDLMISSGNVSLPTGGAVQLQQAVCHLKPLPTALIAEHRAWMAVNLKVGLLLGKPSPRIHPCQTLGTALRSLQLQYQPHALFGMHRADAALRHQSDDSALLLIVVTRPSDFLINCPKRLLGSTKFRYDALARHGTLLVVPWERCNTGYLKLRLEEATGLPLYEAFQVHTPGLSRKGPRKAAARWVQCSKVLPQCTVCWASNWKTE